MDYIDSYARWREVVGMRKNGEPLPEQWDTRSAFAEGVAVGFFFGAEARHRLAMRATPTTDVSEPDST